MSTDSITAETLLRELRGEAVGGAPIPEAPCRAMFRPRGVIQLLALVAASLDDGHGPTETDLIEASNDVGYATSPGTAYPPQHDLADEGPLEAHETVRRERYAVVDEAAAIASVRIRVRSVRMCSRVEYMERTARGERSKVW